MGISLNLIAKMEAQGLLGNGKISVLDIGSSNLYGATEAGIEDFLLTFDIAPTPDVVAFSERLARESVPDPSRDANNAFVGELLERVGMNYRSIDIADGYKTTVLDLNHGVLPRQFVGAFDLVMNFGTTEHLLNQYNAFRVIHDATKVGGYIVHSVPWLGYSDHGYFTYTPRCFFDLAGYNEYELTDFWFDATTVANDLYAGLRNYSKIFPKLDEFLKRDQTEAGRRIGALEIPDVGMMVVFRKVKARPFMGALEMSTSVGNVAAKVTAAYETAPLRSVATKLKWWRADTEVDTLPARDKGKAAANFTAPVNRHDEMMLEGEAKKLREKLVWNRITNDECMKLYALVAAAKGYFPYDWEEIMLVRLLAREPNRTDLSDRLTVVRDYLADGKTSGPAPAK